MKHTGSLTVGSILGLLWALPLLAQNGEEGAAEQRSEASRQSVWAESQKALLAGIELSAEQRGEIEALDAEFGGEIDAQQQHRSQLRKDLNAAEQAGKVSEAKRIRGKLRELRRTPGRGAHVNAIREVLNDEQRVSFDENRKAFRERARQQRNRARRERPPRPTPSEGATKGKTAAEGADEAPP